MRDGSLATPGTMPWIEGVGPDPARVLRDVHPGANETWTWATPRATFPQGTYRVCVESYRASESLHYSQHVEKIYVNR